MKNKLAVILCLFAVLSPAGAIAADDTKSEDKEAVSTLVKEAVGDVLIVLQRKDLSKFEKREQVMKIIRPFANFELMAQLSLPKKVRKTITDKQKATYTELYVETIKRSYFDKLLLFTNETVEFSEPVARGTAKLAYSMVTHVVSGGDRVEVAYAVTKRKDAWKVYDFKIEGVSLRKSYRSQYTDYLSGGKDIDDLIALMQRKIDKLKAEEAKEKAAKEKAAKARAAKAKEPKKTDSKDKLEKNESGDKSKAKSKKTAEEKTRS